MGSPPPMRGKVMRDEKVAFYERITPAYAGKSPPFIIEVYHFLGSPPPMRGKGFVLDRLPKRIGITPAYAGKSLQAYFSRSNSSGSPPPMRGKVSTRQKCVCQAAGSPPPMRGKGWRVNHDSGIWRITPAYAGKRTKCFVTSSQT